MKDGGMLVVAGRRAQKGGREVRARLFLLLAEAIFSAVIS